MLSFAVASQPSAERHDERSAQEKQPVEPLIKGNMVLKKEVLVNLKERGGTQMKTLLLLFQLRAIKEKQRLLL